MLKLPKSRYYLVALLLVPVATALRLYFFSGYGLGDDPNLMGSIEVALSEGGLVPENVYHSRPLFILIGVLSFILFGINEIGFILPVLFFSVAIHLVCVVFTNRLVSSRTSFFVSLFFLISPFETLCSTAMVFDYYLAFFSLLAAFYLQIGITKDSAKAMVLSSLFLFLSLLVKMSALVAYPVFLLLCLVTVRKGKLWGFFWLSNVVFISFLCIFYFHLSGNPLHWFTFGTFPPYDVTDNLLNELLAYPKYLLLTDEFGNSMFAGITWLAIPVFILSILKTKQRDLSYSGIYIFLSFSFIYILTFIFVPHKISFSAYHSVPRVFRYLVQLSPFIYIAAAFLVGELLWKRYRLLSWSITIIVCLFSFSQTPTLARTLGGPNVDGRKLVSFFTKKGIEKPTLVATNSWYCGWVALFAKKENQEIRLSCTSEYSNEEKEKFLQGIDYGYVVTGGGQLIWYSHLGFGLNLEEMKFEIPDYWKLVYEGESSKEIWRKEPLRIWYVQKKELLEPVFKEGELSSNWNRCLRGGRSI